MEMIYIDFVAVIIAAFLFLLIGSFWFSDLMFKKTYRKALELTKEDMNGGWKKWLGTIVIAFIVSYILAFLEALLGVVSVLEGLYVGVGVFIGFILPSHLLKLMWANRPCTPFFIEMGYMFFAILVIAGFLGA